MWQGETVSRRWRSADGSLLIEERTGRWGDRSDGSWSVVRDAASDRVLLDLGKVQTARVVPQEDGALFLWLMDAPSQRLFRIDPPGRTFRNQGAGGASLPLDRLQAEVDLKAERLAEDYFEKRSCIISADGAIRVDFALHELRSWSWETPRITRIADGFVLMDAPPEWNGRVRLSDEGFIDVELDLVSEAGRAEVTIDPRGDRWRDAEGGAWQPIASLKDAMAEALEPGPPKPQPVESGSVEPSIPHSPPRERDWNRIFFWFFSILAVCIILWLASMNPDPGARARRAAAQQD